MSFEHEKNGVRIVGICAVLLYIAYHQRCAGDGGTLGENPSLGVHWVLPRPALGDDMGNFHTDPVDVEGTGERFWGAF
jgi:hypothetical protein